ncbi:hypothetical protein KBD59_04325 [Candidatus Gracilibacteria bacterium]|nr:hypothetical protein [Candidatus Gracilibacteria bacterium]
MDTSIGTHQQPLLDLTKILEDIFLVLSPKEKEVIIKRFSLNNEPKQTLEKIGQQFSVTRERVRQIEKIALGKLRRTLENSKLSEVARVAKELTTTHGGLCEEEQLTSEILQEIASTSEPDGHIVKLALAIHPELIRVEKNGVYHAFWKIKGISDESIAMVCGLVHEILLKKKEVVSIAEVVNEVESDVKERNAPVNLSREAIISALRVDVRFKRVPEGIGLVMWRHINPKSIRDKAYIVLKREAKPLHFVEIANRITESAFDRKVVTTQAVHNELIRDEHFVLVGRGLYGLKEWGYRRGTVADIIEDLLRKKSPLTKQEIMAGVLKQRHVKKGTISLNLQKNPQFVRVGRAVYALDESKKA